MTPILDPARQVFTCAWRLLPRIKRRAAIARVRVGQLGAVHGRYHPVDCRCGDPDCPGLLELNEAMFGGERTHLVDDAGQEHPYRGPRTPRALHTCLHELAHAIGQATGLDETGLWLDLSGWEETPADAFGTARYVERRPGWEPGRSPWRYRAGAFFCRPYSAKSPFEDFADCVTYRALGWTHVFGRSREGRRKLAYVDDFVWDARGRAPARARVRALLSDRSGPGTLILPAFRRRRVA